jgi:hypothetical protein
VEEEEGMLTGGGEGGEGCSEYIFWRRSGIETCMVPNKGSWPSKKGAPAFSQLHGSLSRHTHQTGACPPSSRGGGDGVHPLFPGPGKMPASFPKKSVNLN